MTNTVSHKKKDKKVFLHLIEFQFLPKQSLRQQEKFESHILKSITYHLQTE